jgi:hypothetical protein
MENSPDAEAELSQDDIEYLNTLDKKLNSKKLTVTSTPVMHGLASCSKRHSR